MPQSYKEIFAHLQSPEPPEELFFAVMQRIHQAQRVVIWQRLVVSGAGVIGCVIAFIFTFRMMITESVESGFREFLTLYVSDVNVALHNWQSLTLALLESLPVTSTIVSLIVVAISLWCIRIIIKNVKYIFV